MRCTTDVQCLVRQNFTLLATNYKTANQFKFQRYDGIGAMEGTYSKVPIIRTDPIFLRLFCLFCLKMCVPKIET